MKRFLASYVVIAAIAIVMVGLFTSKTIRILTQNIQKSNLNILIQTSDMINARAEEAANVAAAITVSSQTSSILRVENPLQGNNIYKTHEYCDYLKQYITPNSIIKEIILDNSEQNGCILYSLGAAETDRFLREIYKQPSAEAQKWFPGGKSLLQKGQLYTVEKMHLNGEIQTVAVYVQQMPFGRKTGSIVVLMDANQLFGPAFKTGGLYVLNSGSEIIFGQADKLIDKELPEEQMGYFVRDGMIVSFVRNSGMGVTLVSALPLSVAMQEANELKGLLFHLILIGSVICLVVVAALTVHSTKPIYRVLDTLSRHVVPGTANKDRPMSFLQDSIERIVSENAQLQNTMEKQREALQTAFVLKLIRGDFDDSEEIRTSARQLDIAMGEKNFIGAVIQIAGLSITGSAAEDRSRKLHAVKTILRDMLGSIQCHMQIVEAEVDQLNLLMSFNISDTAQCIQICGDFLSPVQSRLKNECNIPVLIAVGNAYPKPTDVYLSFDEAASALVLYDFKTDNAVFCCNLPKMPVQLYHYPVEMEIRLTNLIKSGSVKEIEGFLDVLYQENYTKRKLSTFMSRNLFYKIGNTILKVVNDIYVTDPHQFYHFSKRINQYKELISDKERFIYIKSVLTDLCNMINLNKKSHNSTLTEELLRYVHDNFRSPMLSLSSAAGYCKISENYLSVFFKEQVGENFINYVEDLRMREARELLRRSEITINQLSESVGYSSAAVFRRAFKRKYGVSPAAYAKTLSVEVKS